MECLLKLRVIFFILEFFHRFLKVIRKKVILRVYRLIIKETMKKLIQISINIILKNLTS